MMKSVFALALAGLCLGLAGTALGAQLPAVPNPSAQVVQNAAASWGGSGDLNCFYYSCAPSGPTMNVRLTPLCAESGGVGGSSSCANQPNTQAPLGYFVFAYIECPDGSSTWISARGALTAGEVVVANDVAYATISGSVTCGTLGYYNNNAPNNGSWTLSVKMTYTGDGGSFTYGNPETDYTVDRNNAAVADGSVYFDSLACPGNASPPPCLQATTFPTTSNADIWIKSITSTGL